MPLLKISGRDLLFSTKSIKPLNKQSLCLGLLWFLFLFAFLFLGNCQSKDIKSKTLSKFQSRFRQAARTIYKSCHLYDRLRFDIFCRALAGSRQDYFKKSDIVTIIDYTQPSTSKRCFVIDVKKRRLLYNTFVAHGINSGANIAQRFSNRKGSKISSLGFYRTGDCYIGKYGYSLKLEGLEKGINSNARKRRIVMHGADNVNREFIEKYGLLGRSWGCPTLPRKVIRKIIDVIKGGSCLFIYADDRNYLINTDFLRISRSG